MTLFILLFVYSQVGFGVWYALKDRPYFSTNSLEQSVLLFVVLFLLWPFFVTGAFVTWLDKQ